MVNFNQTWDEGIQVCQMKGHTMPSALPLSLSYLNNKFVYDQKYILIQKFMVFF